MGGRGAKLATVIGAAVAALGFAPDAGAEWKQIPGGATPVTGSETAFALGPDMSVVGGVPYLVWKEFPGSNEDMRAARLTPAGTWEKVGESAPIKASAASSTGVSATTIGGVLYAAWSENDGTNFEVRVARLNPAATAWERVADSASPINVSPTQNAFSVTIEGIGGVPYVAWSESDGTHRQIRVARLNAGGTAWEPVVTGVSPVNHSSANDAHDPSLTSIGGVPWIAWSENDMTNEEIRVAHLDGPGTDWIEIGPAASPVNASPSAAAANPHVISFGGLPHVAWTEDDAGGGEVRVARLNGTG